MPGTRAKPIPIKLLKVDGLAAPVQIRRDPRARRLTLRVSRTDREVMLTIPRNIAFSEADRFLARSLDWVRERLESVPDRVPFRCGAVMPLRGEMHSLTFLAPERGRPVVEAVAPAVNGARLLVRGAVEHAPRRLKDWLIGEARRDLDARVMHHCANLSLRARRISIRDQKSRWGSCSSDGQLSFSWRLIMAPPIVLDYVAAHEVAHLMEMNHGPRFWRLVARTMPDMDEARCWLRQHGLELYRYGL